MIRCVKDRLLGVARVPLSGIISADRARIAVSIIIIIVIIYSSKTKSRNC